MFWISLVGSSVVAVLFSLHFIVVSIRKTNHDPLIAWLCTLIPGLCFLGSPSYFLSLAILFGSAFGLWITGRFLKRDVFWWIVPTAIVSIILGHGVILHYEHLKLATIRNKLTVFYPDQELNRPADTLYPVIPIFDDTELQTDTSTQQILKNLHDQQVIYFVTAPGFGISRGVMPVERFLRDLPFRRTPVPQPGEPFSVDSLGEFDHPVVILKPEMEKFNQSALQHFLFPQGWGYRRDDKSYFGFASHQMGLRDSDWRNHPVPTFDSWTNASLRSIQLVGLLLAPEPRVYVTKNLPRMDEAKKSPTRPLDPFEKAGLDAVGKGEPIYIGRHVSQPIIRAIGPLRATKGCMECHGCQDGQLLGAFSYTIEQK